MSIHRETDLSVSDVLSPRCAGHEVADTAHSITIGELGKREVSQVCGLMPEILQFSIGVAMTA